MKLYDDFIITDTQRLEIFEAICLINLTIEWIIHKIDNATNFETEIKNLQTTMYNTLLEKGYTINIYKILESSIRRFIKLCHVCQCQCFLLFKNNNYIMGNRFDLFRKFLSEANFENYNNISECIDDRRKTNQK